MPISKTQDCVTDIFSITQDLFFKLRISSRNKSKSFSLIFFVCKQAAHPVGEIPWDT